MSRASPKPAKSPERGPCAPHAPKFEQPGACRPSAPQNLSNQIDARKVRISPIVIAQIAG
jgi:hypothetical protein